MKIAKGGNVKVHHVPHNCMRCGVRTETLWQLRIVNVYGDQWFHFCPECYTTGSYQTLLDMLPRLDDPMTPEAYRERRDAVRAYNCCGCVLMLALLVVGLAVLACIGRSWLALLVGLG